MQKLLVFIIGFIATGLAQAPAAKPQAPATAHRTVASAKSDVDTVIELVKSGMSEPLVIKTLQGQGKTYALAPAELLKLHKAGVPESIISVMMDPRTMVNASLTPPVATPAVPSGTAAGKDYSPEGAAPAPAPLPPAETAAVTPFPPDLPDVPARTPRLIVDSFGHRNVNEQAQYWFNNNSVDVGAGVSDLLSSRLNNTPGFTLLERNKLEKIRIEQDRQNTDRFDQGKRIQWGRLAGADYMLIGDIVQFGWDSKAKRHTIPSIVIPKIPFGGFSWLSKEDKGVVAISFRIVDAETGQQVAGLSGDAKSESSRKSKDYSGTLAIQGAGWLNGGGDMTSTAFCKTIIGEATSSAVDKIVEQLRAKVAQLPPKPRSIEGKLASVSSNGIYLALGANQGVIRGDRFEILQIIDGILDPDTQEKLGVKGVKLGELVVSDVREKFASGAYGGQPLSDEYCKGKGYLARLIFK